MRPSPFRRLACVGAPPLLLTLAALPACSSSSTAAPTTLDPPHLRIESIQPVGGPSWPADPPCLAPGTDPAKTLSVNVGPTDGSGHLISPNKPPTAWTISPPQTCTGTPPCGFLVLTLDGCTSSDPASCGTDPSSHYEVIGSGPSIFVSMAALPNPLGFYRFHVELKNQDATPAEDEKGDTFPAEVVVEVVERCGERPPPVDSGAPHRDASSDAQIIGPDTGPSEPRDAGVIPDGSAVPEAGPPPTDAATPNPDGAQPRPDAHVPVPDAARTPVDSGPVIPPRDALVPI